MNQNNSESINNIFILFILSPGISKKKLSKINLNII